MFIVLDVTNACFKCTACPLCSFKKKSVMFITGLSCQQVHHNRQLGAGLYASMIANKVHLDDVLHILGNFKTNDVFLSY